MYLIDSPLLQPSSNRQVTLHIPHHESEGQPGGCERKSVQVWEVWLDRGEEESIHTLHEAPHPPRCIAILLYILLHEGRNFRRAPGSLPHVPRPH